MSKQETYLEALDRQGLFEDSAHRTRFKELLDCYADYPFFSKGLCKCMYLSAWDEEHFALMLEILTELTLGKERDTGEMRMQGERLAEEKTGGGEYVFQLSNAFLDGREFRLEENASIGPEHRHIIGQALLAAERIDSDTL